MVPLSDALASVYLRRPPVRPAIERKRAEAIERDIRRFVAAAAHLPDSAFADEPHPIREELCAGLGRTRRILMVELWYDELRRRGARTTHEAIAERRLAAGRGIEKC